MMHEFIHGDVRFAMQTDSEYEQQRFNSVVDKEPETIDWIRDFVSPGQVLYDVGANVGIYTLYAAAYHGSAVAIYSFEPVFHNFNSLCANIHHNHFDWVMPYGIAVGEKTLLSKIDLASVVAGSASHLMEGTPDAVAENFAKTFSQGVMTVSLTDLVGSFGIPAPHHIKIDVDGFEEMIIRGASGALSHQNLRSILIEVTDRGGALDRITGHMAQYGFHDQHPINRQERHSRVRREQKGTGYIKNVIFTRDNSYADAK